MSRRLIALATPRPTRLPGRAHVLARVVGVGELPSTAGGVPVWQFFLVGAGIGVASAALPVLVGTGTLGTFLLAGAVGGALVGACGLASAAASTPMT